MPHSRVDPADLPPVQGSVPDHIPPLSIKMSVYLLRIWSVLAHLSFLSNEPAASNPSPVNQEGLVEHVPGVLASEPSLEVSLSTCAWGMPPRLLWLPPGHLPCSPKLWLKYKVAATDIRSSGEIEMMVEKCGWLQGSRGISTKRAVGILRHIQCILPGASWVKWSTWSPLWSIWMFTHRITIEACWFKC